VARQLRHWLAEPSLCAYLPDRMATLEYRLLLDVTPAELDALLARGWRRFGPAYFRPACSGCRECVPLRVLVDRFRPSKSQRRVWNKVSSRLRVERGRPKIDEARLDLYHRWHAAQGGKRDWPADLLDAEEYYHQFAFPHPAGEEMAYWDDDPPGGGEPRLVGVAITDVTPLALSAVYTYYDPAYAKLSLGTASVLFQVERARQEGRPFVYLGFRVEGCPSSVYKARFRPHQLLAGPCGLEEEPRWVDVEARSGGVGAEG
jgi:arginine-tRNA-protein transferase